MKVLLVQAYQGRYEPEGAIFPIGLCYISTALNEHEVRILDLNLFVHPYDELRKTLEDFDPDIVGLSLRNIDTTQRRDIFYYFKTLKPTVRLVKEFRPSTRLVLGGSGFSMFAREIMERVTEIDFGVYLEGEESTPELLKNLDNADFVKGIFIRKGDQVVFTGPRPLPDMKSLGIPNRQLIDVNRYKHPVYTNIGVQTKRGCSLMCAYCSYPFLNGRKIRVRPYSQVVDEIEHLKNQFDVRRFMFVDSVFNIPEQHAEGICREIIRRRIDVEWSAFFDMRRFSKELLTLAIEAGCRNFSFSPDAVTDASLKALGKGISEKDISRVMRMLKQTKRVRAEFHVFCTPPGQTLLGFAKTLLFYLKVNALFLGRAVVHFGWIRIEPETRMYELAKSDGIISEETNLLPVEEKALRELFYSCPRTRAYGDPVINAMLAVQERLYPLVKRVIRR